MLKTDLLAKRGCDGDFQLDPPIELRFDDQAVARMVAKKEDRPSMLLATFEMLLYLEPLQCRGRASELSCSSAKKQQRHHRSHLGMALHRHTAHYFSRSVGGTDRSVRVLTHPFDRVQPTPCICLLLTCTLVR